MRTLRHLAWIVVALAGPLTAQAPARVPPPGWAKAWGGTWYTNQGVFELVPAAKQNEFEGHFGTRTPKRSVRATASGKKLTLQWEAGKERGEGVIEQGASGAGFTGTWRQKDGAFRGWRQDPKATQGRPADLAGHWRSGWGMLQLEQKGKTVTGVLGAAGFTKVSGQIEGQRLTLHYEAPWGAGELWAELRDEGKALYGGAKAEQGVDEWSWAGRRLAGHTLAAPPRPGAIVDAVAKNRLVYHLRVPKTWKSGARLPALVFLHGSNYASRPYLETIAERDGLGDRFVIVGVDGEQWNDDSSDDDPRQNYTYVNWMGKSTYRGFPNTERESPALVAELIGDLKTQLGLTKVFVGGHSQGGFLTWFFPMHFPELVDGVFPIAAGLVMQNEPDVFDQPDLQAAQRRVPIAVVHGRNDEAVPFGQGFDAFERLLEFGFPAARLFEAKAPHAFVALPWAEAIAWLEAQSGDDVDALARAAAAALEADRPRDATAAVRRGRTLQPTPPQTQALDAVMAKVDAMAAADAARLQALIEANASSAWIDEFRTFRARFEFADVARPLMATFAALRTEHEPKAAELVGEARRLFREQKADEAWRRYEEVVKTCYASTHYPRVKRWLADRR